MYSPRTAAHRWALVAAAVLVAAGLVAPTAAYAKTRTVFTASLNKSTCTYASPATLTGILKTSSGRVLGYKYVALYRGSTRVGTYRTNAYGRVAIKVKYPGSVSWRLRYPGDASYYASYTPYRATKASFLVNSSFLGRTISGSVYLVAGRPYQWIVNGKAPTILIESASGVRASYAKLGQTTVWTETGPETTYYWWYEARAFKAPKSLYYRWSVTGQYYPSRTGYFRIW